MDFTTLQVKDPVLRARLERFSHDERFRIENLLVIRDLNERGDIPLRYNEAQLALYKKYRRCREQRRPVRIIICKARRAGLSTGVASLIYDDCTTHAKTNALIVGHERSPSINILDMYTRFWRNSPASWDIEGQRVKIRPDLPRSFNNNPPSDRLVFAEPLESRIFVATARNINAYLGSGFQNIHATEAGYYEDGAGLFRALGPTLVKVAHSALYIESTPNGQQGKGAWFYERCMAALHNKNSEYGQTELVFIPWHEMRISFTLPIAQEKRKAFEQSLDAKERDLLKRFPHISLEQLSWRRMMLYGETCGGDEDVFDQEFPTDLATAFLMSGASVYSRRAIKRLMQDPVRGVRPPIWEGDIFWGEGDEENEGEPIHELVRRPIFLKDYQAKEQGRKSHTNENTYRNLKVWRWPHEGEKLLVTADIGGGRAHTKDGDYTVIYVGVLNALARDEIIMRWRGHLNEIALGEVAAALCWALTQMVGDSVKMPEFIPEWTGPGKATCDYMDHMRLYPNIYKYRHIGAVGAPATKHLGWESNSKTKPLMVGYSVRMVDSDAIDIPDELLVTEMSSYRKMDAMDNEMSFGAASGTHDDCVSSFQILCAALRMSEPVLPGDQPMATEVDDGLFDDDAPPWDFSRPVAVPGMPGVFDTDIGNIGEQEETLWYADRDPW